ncbi:MAG: AAA-like domain-containing protein [Armatimonadetes bacterium]|nr:AAA-like domain-containing protein [Armatimonadota bacterium]
MEISTFPSPSRAAWTVHMLGQSPALEAAGRSPGTGAKRALLLLAYLLLNEGRPLSRFHLQDLMWPDKDGDRQAQNLRKAVSDLRAVFEELGLPERFVETARNSVAIDASSGWCDVSVFTQQATRGITEQDLGALLAAVDVYGGPLLAPWDDGWAVPYRLELEELYGQAVEQACRILGQRGDWKEATRIGRNAAKLAPLREDIHIALISSYRMAGMEAEAVRQFETLEQLLDETWGELPSARARAALEGAPEAQPLAALPAPEAVSKTFADIDAVGGAVPMDSPFYVRRPVDEAIERCLERHEATILIQGPRQVGKSSLLARAISLAGKAGTRVVVTDFQAIGRSQIADEEKMYRVLAHAFASGVASDIDVRGLWNEWLGPKANLDAVLGQVLSGIDQPVVWAFDECDRLFGQDYADDFFGLLRSWHNRRALDTKGDWKKLSLVLSYATEAHLFIADMNQSPFNVGVKLKVSDFSQEEVGSLAERYDIPGGQHQTDVFEITSGQPYLTRRSFAFLSQGQTIEELRATSSDDDGPFCDHLRRILDSLSTDPALTAEVARLLAGSPFERSNTVFRLVSSGVVKVGSQGVPEFRVPAYRDYLGRHLLPARTES